MYTAASISIRGSQAYLRKAGAQARQMLLEEAGARWRVPPSECSARDSIITHDETRRTGRYGEIAAAAARRAGPPEVMLKPPEEGRLIGKPIPRLDVADKSLGRPIYASDVRLPGMLFASVSACPALGGRLGSFGGAKVMGMPGGRRGLGGGGNAVPVLS